MKLSGKFRRLTRRKTSSSSGANLPPAPPPEPEATESVPPIHPSMYPVLRRLVLEGCNIGNRGASSLAEALHSNRSLTHLGLSGNEIGDQGACAIGSMLFKNDTLLELDLSWNMVKALGAQAISIGMSNVSAVRNPIAYVSWGDDFFPW
jgi:hypothetical protein